MTWGGPVVYKSDAYITHYKRLEQEVKLNMNSWC